ncbi:hypothetical protein ACOM2C_10975 [Pseudarthrobacter sp. So.54]
MTEENDGPGDAGTPGMRPAAADGDRSAPAVPAKRTHSSPATSDAAAPVGAANAAWSRTLLLRRLRTPAAGSVVRHP